MKVVDSSGWLEYFAKGPNGPTFRDAIQSTEELIVPTITFYEVFKRIMSQSEEEEVLKAISWMARGTVVDLTQEIAMQAAAISLEEKLAMANSIILATARAWEAELWTQDEHFAGMEGVHYILKGK